MSNVTRKETQPETGNCRGPLNKAECASVRRHILESGEVEASHTLGIGRHVALRAAAELPLSAADRYMIRARLNEIGQVKAT